MLQGGDGGGANPNQNFCRKVWFEGGRAIPSQNVLQKLWFEVDLIGNTIPRPYLGGFKEKPGGRVGGGAPMNTGAKNSPTVAGGFQQKSEQTNRRAGGRVDRRRADGRPGERAYDHSDERIAVQTIGARRVGVPTGRKTCMHTYTMALPGTS